MSTPALARATETLIDRSDAYDPDELVARAVVDAALHDPDNPDWLYVVVAIAIRDFHAGPAPQPLAACVVDALRAAILGAPRVSTPAASPRAQPLRRPHSNGPAR